MRHPAVSFLPQGGGDPLIQIHDLSGTPQTAAPMTRETAARLHQKIGEWLRTTPQDDLHPKSKTEGLG